MRSVPSPARFRYNLSDKIAQFEESIADTLVVRAFDKNCLVDGNVVSDFFSILGAPTFHTTVTPAKNISLSAEGVILMQTYGRLLHPNDIPPDQRKPKDVRILEQALYRHRNGTKPQPSPPTRAYILEADRNEIATLKQRWGVEFRLEVNNGRAFDCPSASNRFIDHFEYRKGALFGAGFRALIEILRILVRWSFRRPFQLVLRQFRQTTST